MTIVAERPTATTTLTLVPLDHPELRRIRRWSDREALHRAVMRLFPDQLVGDPQVRRATAGILFRHDTPGKNPDRLLIQHTTPMRADIIGSRDLRQAGLDPLLKSLEIDQLVRFRVVLNAVRSQTITKKRVAVTDPDDLILWGMQRLEAAGLNGIELSDQPTTSLAFTSGAPVWTAQYDGYANVSDSGTLTEAVRKGIGRAKAYGCGLLSLAPVGP